MKRNSILSMVASACFFMPGALLKAEDKAEPATIRLSHGVLRYDSISDETKVGNTSSKTDSTGFTTFPAGIEIAAFAKGYAVYAYPVNQGYSVLFGKSIGSDMEAGISATINSHNVKDGDEETRNSIGGYYFFTAPISSAVNFEFDINPALIMGSGKTTSGSGGTPVTEKQDISGYSLYLDLLGVVPIAKNFEYVFGIDYNYLKRDTKLKTGGVSTTEKFTSGGLGLILAKFRYYI